MLREEQVAELLKRCEVLTGVTLSQARGNLWHAQSRAAAIWELLVVEETARLGKVAYEPNEGPSPDIRLTLESGESIWVEAAFLYPRFWKEERQSEAVTLWIADEAERLGIPAFKVSCEFDGDRTDAGFVRRVPELNEKKMFLKEGAVRRFFQAICQDPLLDTSSSHDRYSLVLRYSAGAARPYLHSGGLVQEAPRRIKQHALYRVLKSKARQHRMSGKRVICIGSDQSGALSRTAAPGGPTLERAIGAAFSESQSLSGVVVVRVEASHRPLAGLERKAKALLFTNPRAREPLAPETVEALSHLDFNRWRYCHPMVPYKRHLGFGDRRLGGHLVIGNGGRGMRVEIPTTIVMECLAGRTSLFRQYGTKSNDPLDKPLREGWAIRSCSLKAGNIESGEAPKLILELEPPPERVFGTEQAG